MFLQVITVMLSDWMDGTLTLPIQVLATISLLLNHILYLSFLKTSVLSKELHPVSAH
jgi:hypothetical protein